MPERDFVDVSLVLRFGFRKSASSLATAACQLLERIRADQAWIAAHDTPG
jgi:hypothetical protein